jgi:mRNA interferase RelE/StbE
VSRYTVYVTPTAWDEVQDLPGHMRQRIRRAIAGLADEPRPAESKALVRPVQQEALDTQDTAASVEDALQGPVYELRRIRLDRWRIVYAITEVDLAIDILTVRKRPPYDYGDLERLLSEIYT